MAIVPYLVTSIDIDNKNNIIIEHNANSPVIFQLLINSEVDNTKILKIKTDINNPLNSCIVYFTQTITGTIQVFKSPTISSIDLSPQESAAVSIMAASPGDPPIKRSELDAATSNKTWIDPINVVSTTPPENIDSGYRVLIIGNSPTGSFDGYLGQIASWDGDNWSFEAPIAGTTTTNLEDGIQWIQYGSSSPWNWRSDTGGTAIHGNEKHNPKLITVGGNRSDMAFDILTSNNIADSLHTHQEFSKDKAIFFDDFLGYKYSRYLWYLKKSGTASFEIYKNRIGGQSKTKTSNRESVFLSWRDRYSLKSKDTYLEIRIKKSGKDCYLEVGLENLDGDQIFFSVENFNKWVIKSNSFSEETSINVSGSFQILGIKMGLENTDFFIDGEKVGTCNVINGPYMPFHYQEGYDSNQYSYMDYVYCISGRE